MKRKQNQISMHCQYQNQRRCKMYKIKIHNASETMYTDRPGQLPATSSSGNQYIMVLVKEVNGNHIRHQRWANEKQNSRINDKSIHCTLDTFDSHRSYPTHNTSFGQWSISQIKGRVIQPTTHLLDNEASTKLKAEIKKNCTIQLVPPNNHRQNLAERAIQTLKNILKQY